MTQPTPNNPPTPEIIPPLIREPDAWVENIYPEYPGTEVPDLESQDVMGQYLGQRLLPDATALTHVAWTPSGRSWPHWDRVPAGTKDVTRLRIGFTDRWLVTPKAAATVILSSMALFNLVGNHDTIDGAARYVGHAIDRKFFGDGQDTIYEDRGRIVPGKVTDIHVDATTGSKVGATNIDPASIKTFVDQVKEAEAHGSKLVSINITGNASDEWTSEHSIGRPDAGNAKLDKARAEAAAEAISGDGLKVPARDLQVNGHESVLTPQEKRTIDRTAQQDGYPDIMSALDAADQGQKLPHRLASQIKRLFTGSHLRGVSIDAKIQHKGHATFHDKFVPLHVDKPNHKPDVPSPHWYWFIPMIPIRRMWSEKYGKTKDVKRWEYNPTEPMPKPTLVRQELDQVWLRLRPEALQEDGSLVEDAWAYNRKYEHLFRDNRFADLLRIDYQDPKGEDKALRMLFVDKSPSDETVTAFERLLTKAAALQAGSVGNRVRAIVVYPSENTGILHGNPPTRQPKIIGMGIDKQYESNILGTYTPSLDLIELHMPSTWDPEELEQLFAEFYGPAWVVGHELAHASDDTDEVLRLRRVHSFGLRNAYVIDGESHADRMRPMDGILRRLWRQRTPEETPLEFDIDYQFTDRNGELITVQGERVQEGDPRLAYAHRSTIVGSQPTRYSGENPDPSSDQNASEHYAETGASVLTGIEIPYGEAGVRVARHNTDGGEVADLATGFRPDVRGQQIFTDSVGGQLGSFPIAFENQPEVRVSHIHPRNDRVIREHFVRTHGLRTLRPHQMISVLARVFQTEDPRNG